MSRRLGLTYLRCVVASSIISRMILAAASEFFAVPKATEMPPPDGMSFSSCASFFSRSSMAFMRSPRSQGQFDLAADAEGALVPVGHRNVDGDLHPRLPLGGAYSTALGLHMQLVAHVSRFENVSFDLHFGSSSHLGFQFAASSMNDGLMMSALLSAVIA